MAEAQIETKKLSRVGKRPVPVPKGVTINEQEPALRKTA